jgi:Wiskott-Aldrich syndrome protein
VGTSEPSTIEDIEGVPHPRYPLPTKPFQVQPAPKITSGYAPTTPLDRTKGKSRRWRPAHREIRGIAGGRWFARTWVGERDSEFAIAAEAALSLPKLPALSISAPAGTRTPGKRKPKADANSTAASSRSASAAPEGVPPPQRSATKKSALSTAVAASEVEMDIDLVS